MSRIKDEIEILTKMQLKLNGVNRKIDENEIAINDNVSALADLGDASEGNADDANSALAELADMYASIDERITALESK